MCGFWIRFEANVQLSIQAALNHMLFINNQHQIDKLQKSMILLYLGAYAFCSFCCVNIEDCTFSLFFVRGYSIIHMVTVNHTLKINSKVTVGSGDCVKIDQGSNNQGCKMVQLHSVIPKWGRQLFRFFGSIETVYFQCAFQIKDLLPKFQLIKAWVSRPYVFMCSIKNLFYSISIFTYMETPFTTMSTLTCPACKET